MSRRKRKWTEAELLEAIREKNTSQAEVGERMIGLYEWMQAQGAQARWGKAVAPSVSLWLGEGADPGVAVAVVIYPDSITIPFVDLIKHRSQTELARLATLAREIPGVAPYLEDLAARDYRRFLNMRPEEVLASDEALDAWKRVLLEATRAG